MHSRFIHYFPYRLPCYFPIDNNIITLVFAEAVDRELRASGYTYMRIDVAISCFFTFVAISWKIPVSVSCLETFRLVALSWNLLGSRLFKSLKNLKMTDVFFGVRSVPKSILEKDRCVFWCTKCRNKMKHNWCVFGLRSVQKRFWKTERSELRVRKAGQSVEQRMGLARPGAI